MNVFFYGLFMDERLLGRKGIRPAQASTGFAEGFALQLGERATLVRHPGERAYGVVMDIDPQEATELYTEESVADYRPESLTVELMDGTRVDAICYNLPGDHVTTANRDYAVLLLEIAIKLRFPESYLDRIRQAITQ